MIPVLKLRDIRPLVPIRAADSHKGMNGKVMIVGGSLELHGAPVLSALGALYSGADLVYLFVPESNFEITRAKYPDFIVYKFPGDYLDSRSIGQILEFSKLCDAILIGPGLDSREETMEALQNLVPTLGITTILDAEAIQVIKDLKEFPLRQKIVITPHHHEFELLTSKSIKISMDLSAKVTLIRTLATDLKINIILKGPDDLIVSELGEVAINSTGNAGMTVGGSGDVLSGFVASLIAQGAPPDAACRIGAYVLGRTGDELFKQKWHCFSASDLALELPYVMREMMA